MLKRSMPGRKETWSGWIKSICFYRAAWLVGGM
jgi:hypothetical protein